MTHAGAGKMALNGLGTLLTAGVTLVFAVTKFRDGAWVVVLVIPALVWIFAAIHAHYREAAGKLSLERYGAPAATPRHRVILPISGVHRGTLAALRYARLLSDDVTAVHVASRRRGDRSVLEKWRLWGEGVRLVIAAVALPAAARAAAGLHRPRVADRRQPNETITIVVAQFVPRLHWHNLLHAQTAYILRLALLSGPGS